MTYEEKSVSVVFLMLVSLWFFRAPGFMTGWGDVLSEEYGKNLDTEFKISDGTAAILMISLLFALPKHVRIKTKIGTIQENIINLRPYIQFLLT